jgi:hypothetical protein
MLSRLALVRTDVSEESSFSIIKVTRIGELGTTLAVASNRRSLILVTLMMETLLSSELSVLTRATRRNITEDGSLPDYFLFNTTIGGAALLFLLSSLHFSSYLPNPSGRTAAPGLTQSLTEMNLPASKGRPVRKADNSQ